MSADLLKALEPIVRRVRTDVSAVKGPAGVSWTRDELTPARLAKHLNGGPARGAALIKPGENTTMIAVLDLDSHKGESSWDEMVVVAGDLVGALVMRGMPANPWRSGGGKGIHLIMLWDDPQDAFSVRSELVEVLGELGFKNGSGGVSRGEIEVFPKQNSVPTGGFGNQFFLPLGGQSEPLIPALGYEAAGKEAAVGLPWLISAPVVKREMPVRPPATLRVEDHALLDKALWAVPNNIDSRDGWFALMCAYKEGGGDKETARAWTAQHDSYTDHGFDGPWDSISVGKPGGTPVDYLFRVAESAGFSDHIDDLFEVMLAAPSEPEPRPTFDMDAKGKEIRITVTNTVRAVARPDMTGLQIRHDLFRDEVMVSRPGVDEWRPLSDADMVALRMELEHIGFKSAPKELARDAAVLVASRNQFDTAILWASKLRWDGVPRVERFMVDYLGCEDKAYTRAVGRYLWTAMAGRCMNPGVQVDMAPILHGGQGLRKSSLIRALVPSDEFFAEVDFNAKEEDTVRNLRGVLVAELAELSGLHTKALEGIKKFMTRRVEKWVPKYKEFSTYFHRRVVFVGSTNEGEILADSTGNRRWLPVDVTKADVEAVERDRDQLWAEGVALFAAGGVDWQDAEKLAAGEHDHYRIEDAWEPAVRAWLAAESLELDDEAKTRNGDKPLTTAQVLQGAINMPVAQVDVLAKKRTVQVMSALGYVSKSVRIPAEEKPVRRWVKK